MKVSYKAALLSAFVFPGVGHFYLKKYWRGLVIMFISLSGLVFIIWSFTASLFNRLDSIMVRIQNGKTILQEISDLIGSNTLTTIPSYDSVFYFILFFWIVAIIDAYRIGKKKEFQDKER